MYKRIRIKWCKLFGHVWGKNNEYGISTCTICQVTAASYPKLLDLSWADEEVK